MFGWGRQSWRVIAALVIASRAIVAPWIVEPLMHETC
jgi:hypothetical protein